jgi:acyl dehydratase
VTESLRTFEDFAPGDVIALGSYTVTAEEIIDFARRFDPQPFHLDEAAGRASPLGGLAASGWHVSSILMRLLAEGWLNQTRSMGSNNVQEMKWLKPVLAGDVLSGELTITGKRRLSSRPGTGLFNIVVRLAGADGVVRTEMTAIVFMGVGSAC